MNSKFVLIGVLICMVSGIIHGRTQVDHDIVVVGAGISGLTAAYFLKDYDVLVLEKNNRTGGRAYTGTHRSFHYAKGTEYLGEPEGALERIIDELKLNPVEIPSPMDARFHDGTFWYGYDGIVRHMITGSNLKTFNRFVNTILTIYKTYDEIPEFEKGSKYAKLDDISASRWFDDNNFPALYKDMYNVSAKGLFGATINEISALSFIAEIAFDYEGFEPIKSLDDLDPNTFEAAKYDRSGSYTFVTGITELTDAITKVMGNKVRLNSLVESVSYDKKKKIYRVMYRNNAGKQETISARCVISAVPAPILLSIANTVLTGEQKDIIGQVPFSDFVTAALFSDVPIWNRSFDLAAPEGYFFTDVYDSTWVERHYTEGLRSKKEYIAGVYVSEQSYIEKKLLTMSDEDIIEHILHDLEKMFPGVSKKVNGYDVYRHVYAYPVMIPGAYKRLQRLHEISNNGFVMAGDFMIYPTFEAAVDSGYIAASKVRKIIKR